LIRKPVGPQWFAPVPFDSVVDACGTDEQPKALPPKSTLRLSREFASGVATNVTGPDEPKASVVQEPLHVPASVFVVNGPVAVALDASTAATAITSAKRIL
jgi:hypothetical protein